MIVNEKADTLINALADPQSTDKKRMIVARFMTGSDLASTIRSVLGGSDVRCAVAFWGRGAETLFDQTTGEQPRIICDVTLGGTSPDALRALGAPKNELLRHIPRLHAKVYLSDRGAIVGSANASQNGVGLDRPPSLVEAGTLLEPNHDNFVQIEAWFEMHWKKAKQVDDSAIMLAAERFRPWQAPGSQSSRPGSLFGLIALDPERFSNVSIVIVGTPTTAAQRAEIRKAVKKEHPGEAKTVDSLPDGGMFGGWKPQDLNRWRRVFIELWMPKQLLSVYGRKVAYFHDPEGAVMSKRDWLSVRQVVGNELPTAEQIANADGTMVRRLLDKHGNRLFSARELVVEIERIATNA